MTVVEGRQILRRSAAGPRRIAIPMPILTCDRALLVGIGVDQARNLKTFATHRAGRPARPRRPARTHDGNVFLAEALVAGARKCRMIRDRVVTGGRSGLAFNSAGWLVRVLNNRAQCPIGLNSFCLRFGVFC